MKNILQPADHMRNLTSYLNKKNSHHQPLHLHHQHQRRGNDSRHEDFNSNDDYNHDDDDDGNIGDDNIADDNIISDDDKIYVLKQLESLLDDVDNARDYHTIGLWPTLLSHLTSHYSKSIRCHTAWAIGTAVKNTYDYQLWTLERIEVMIDTTIPTTTSTTTKHSCYNSNGSDDDDDDVVVVANNCSDQGDHVKNELYSSSNNCSVVDIDGSCSSSSSNNNNIDSIPNYSNYIIVSKAVNITCIELLIDLLDPIYLPSSSIRLSSENKDSLRENVIKKNDNNEDDSDDGSDDDDNTTLIETYDMQKRALYAISSSMRGNLDVQNMILSITYYNNNDNQDKMMIKYIEYLYNIGIKYHFYPYDITRKIWSILSDIVEERNYIRYELTHDIYVMMSKNSSDSNSRSSGGDGVDIIAEKNNENMNNDGDGVLNINLNIDEINDDLNDIHSTNLLGDHIIHDNRWVILASMIMLEYSQDMINYNNHLIIQRSRIDCSSSDCHNDHDSHNECSSIDCSSSRSNIDVDNDGSSNDDSDDVKTKDYISIHSSLRSIITFIQEHLKSASIHSTIRHQDIDSTTTTTSTISSTTPIPSSSAITSISVVSEQVLKAYDIISVLDKDIFEDLLEIFTTTVNIIKNKFNIHT